MEYLRGQFTVIADIPAAIATFAKDHGEGLPAPVAAELAALRPSPVDRLVNLAEALWSQMDAVPPEGQVLCAQLADVAERYQFHDLGQTDRAARMILGCRR